MNPIDDQKRKDAVKALINLAVIEGAILMLVVGVFLATGSMTYLIGGLVGTMVIFGPMFLRWAKEHGAAMKAKPNSDEANHG